jgi:hypothetical protein
VEYLPHARKVEPQNQPFLSNTRTNKGTAGLCRSQTSREQRMIKRKGDTPLGYSRLTALRREQCGIFTPCKNRNHKTCSRHYAKVDEAVFSPCRAELCRAVLRIASHRLLPGNSYKHLDDARVGRGHVTMLAVMSCVSTVT